MVLEERAHHSVVVFHENLFLRHECVHPLFVAQHPSPDILYYMWRPEAHSGGRVKWFVFAPRGYTGLPYTRHCTNHTFVPRAYEAQAEAVGAEVFACTVENVNNTFFTDIF